MILSEAQIMMRDAVRSFAQQEIRPRSVEFEANRGYPTELIEGLGSLGLFGMIAPEAHGGAGADYVSYALALIELAAADGALSTIVSIQNSLLVSGLLKFGSEALKRRFLPDLITGAMIGAFALTEPDAGSDAAALRTRATRVDGGWTLNGSKQFITSGKIAKVAMVFAVTDSAAGKRGISAFILPTDRTGFVVDSVERKLGQAASDTAALRFEDLFVEDELLLGELGEGYRIALSNLEAGRIGIAAQSVGMARAALEIAIAYAKERKSFSVPIIEHQAVGFRLADLATRLEASLQLTLTAAALKDAGQPCLTNASMAKLFASESAETIVSGALQTSTRASTSDTFG
ncbi:acyl-CoA dehydrogenase family protein [Sphingomonas sp.]|uniref:acyl-CoA dehydrogenase family protein n=1 Tax=Sphingomonas sp. TaxID=28214 RepID=UPI003AFF77A1